MNELLMKGIFVGVLIYPTFKVIKYSAESLFSWLSEKLHLDQSHSRHREMEEFIKKFTWSEFQTIHSLSKKVEKLEALLQETK